MRLSRTDLRMLVREELNRFKRSRLSESRRGRSGRNLSESHDGDHSGFVFDDSKLEEYGYVAFYYPDTLGMTYAKAADKLNQIVMRLESKFPDVSFAVEDEAEKGYGISVVVPPIEAIKRFLSH